MKELRDRVAVVTGGASGIGKGMAGRFAAAGMKLVLADVERGPLAEAVAELRAGGASAVGIECDVSKPDAVEALAREAFETFGAVHVLCNNAGVAGGAGKATWESSLDDWSWVLGVNLMGVVHGDPELPAEDARPGRRGPRRQHRVHGGPHPRRRNLRRQQARGGRALREPVERARDARGEGPGLGALPGLGQHAHHRVGAQPPRGSARGAGRAGAASSS